MNDVADLFAILGTAAKDTVVDEIERLVADGTDRDLCRINAIDFAKRRDLDEEQVITGFLHAVSLGLFDIAWNVLCPGCGGVLESNATLKTVIKDAYTCSMCASDYEPTLDELVEVTFTVNPRIRRIAGHSPEQLPLLDYLQQMYFSTGADLPEDFQSAFESMTLESVELEAGERMVLSLQLPQQFIIISEPVTHSVQFIDVKGEAIRERQALSIIYDSDHTQHQALDMRPGPVRISIENRTDARVLPIVYIAGDPLHDLLARRRPFLTAKRLLTNQTFRDLYRTDTLAIGQRLKITSLTFLFTDLRGSTELYERVGDLVAFDLVNEHFRVLHEIVASEAGAVVKTIGDAVMATFPTPDRALSAALRMRDAMRRMNLASGRDDLVLKIGMHEGPCIAVNMNERQDYFGQTVNIASRVQALASAQAIFATSAVIGYPKTAELLKSQALVPVSQSAVLRGMERELTLFAIP